MEWLQWSVWRDLVSCVTNVAQQTKWKWFHNWIITGIRVVYSFCACVSKSSACSSRALWPNTWIQSCDLSDYKTLSLKSRPPCCPTSSESIIWGQSRGFLCCSVYQGDEWKVCGKPQRVEYNLGQGDSRSKLQQTGIWDPTFPLSPEAVCATPAESWYLQSLLVQKAKTYQVVFVATRLPNVSHHVSLITTNK